MQGDKLVPKKIRDSPASEEQKVALATIWQYEVNRADRTRGPYKDIYKSAIKTGTDQVGAEYED